jgi:Leucine-rich repeat (LRR) protein
MDGSIPRENGLLTTLSILQIAGSSAVTGSIPTELCSLTNLKVMSMSLNRLSNSIPSCLGDLRNLEVLNVAVNGLTGSIPTELCQLSNLNTMYLTLNSLSGSIPPCLGSLPIAQLDLAHNLLTGAIPTELENLEDTLLVLSTDDNMFTGDPSDVFTKLPRLTHLTSSYNRLNFTMASNFLENTIYLKTLDLSNNEISGSFPVHLMTYNYPFLTVMDLSQNDLIGEFSDNVNIVRPFLYLGAHDNRMTGSIENLVNLTNLVHLDLSNNQFTGPMDPAGQWMEVQNLFLSENSFDPGPIPESFAQLRNIQELSLRNTNRTGTIPENIAQNWTFVEMIDLGSNELVGPIPENFGELLNLQYLLLFDNDGINGSVPAGFKFRTQLKGVLLDRTSIDGMEALELFCALPNFQNVTGTELLIVDCDQDECTECDGCRCCNSAESSACSRPQLGNIDGFWINDFRRPWNEFNFTDEMKLTDGN